MGVEWIGAIGLVAAAVVTGLFSINLRRLNHDNTEQHNRSIDKLDHLTNKVEDVAEDVTGLTVWTKVHDEKHRLIERSDDGS